LRHVAGLGQDEFAKQLGIASGSVSKLENGRMPFSAGLVESIGAVLGCTPHFLTSSTDLGQPSKPWLRAYADAPKRVLDQIVDDCATAMEAVIDLKLKRLPNIIPPFTGDPMDQADIEELAIDVRVAAGFEDNEVVSNSIRAAERLGCIVLPMADELGRHLGLSVRANDTGLICLGRWTSNGVPVPGDRQRWTLAHEIGHLALHAGQGPPATAEEANQIEKQAHTFAGAFLAPGDAMLGELDRLGGRVTLQTLARIKETWGVSIKALVTRFRNLNVIDADHARSLFKQISARGWNKSEPVLVGTEKAIWLSRAIEQGMRGAADPIAEAAHTVGLHRRHLDRWTDWSVRESFAEVLTAEFGKNQVSTRPADGEMSSPPIELLSTRKRKSQ
jgi:Zn-dependent peptidase ImmA (M78 family)/DNA-binding XRE family transcriptional regulator